MIDPFTTILTGPMEPKPAKLWRKRAAMMAALMLGGSTDSAALLLTGGQPVLGSRLRVDAATRAKFCSKSASSSCRITDRDALMAFVEATAARPDRKGAPAIVIDPRGRWA